jgi:hypothetical protein
LFNVVASSPLLALLRIAATTIAYIFLLVGVGVAIILALSVFIMLLPHLLNLSAFSTAAGENGKIAFSGNRDTIEEIVMNADASGQTRRLTIRATFGDSAPDWSPDGTKIALDRDGNSNIYVMNAADGTE